MSYLCLQNIFYQISWEDHICYLYFVWSCLFHFVLLKEGLHVCQRCFSWSWYVVEAKLMWSSYNYKLTGMDAQALSRKYKCNTRLYRSTYLCCWVITTLLCCTVNETTKENLPHKTLVIKGGYWWNYFTWY